MRLAESERIKFGCVVNLVVVVRLVGNEDDGELRAAQNLSHVLVPVRQSCLDVHEEEHEVCLFCCHDHLLADGVLEDVVALHHPSAGVYN